jgi:agmatine deiminase
MEERTPRVDGLFMPARWAEHDRTLIQWPNRRAWWDEHLADAKREFADVVRLISRFDPVTVIANPGLKSEVVEMCGADNVEVVEIPIDDAWVRDSGPIFVVDGRGGVAMTHFGFNAWGGKTEHYEDDAAVGKHLAEFLHMRRYVAPLIAEGGGITVDGEGTMITTETVHLNPNRNPGMEREEVDAVFRDYLGVEKVIWIPHGLAEDMGERGTDGHSDNVVQFIRPGLVLLQTAPDRSNPNWDLSLENRARLGSETDAMGRKLEIVEMPYLPYSKVDGQPYAAPYTNFYPVNGGIVAPQLDATDEDKAFAILQDLFQDREIVGAPTVFQAFGGGGTGCITQQVPSGAPLAPNAASA